jgi:hypothetical protein
MQERWATAVPCADGFGRPKTALVTITDENEVAVVTPAGGSAVWKPGDVFQLQQALTNAQVEAVHRRGGEH